MFSSMETHSLLKVCTQFLTCFLNICCLIKKEHIRKCLSWIKLINLGFEEGHDKFSIFFSTIHHVTSTIKDCYDCWGLTSTHGQHVQERHPFNCCTISNPAKPKHIGILCCQPFITVIDGLKINIQQIA